MNNKIPEFKTLKPLINSLIFKYYKLYGKVRTNDDIYQDIYVIYNDCRRLFKPELNKSFDRYFISSIIHHIKIKQFRELREQVYIDKYGSFDISLNDIGKAKYNSRLSYQIKDLDKYENQLRHNFEGVSNENLEEQAHYRLFWEIELPKYMKKKELKLLGERYGYDIKNGEPSKRKYSLKELMSKYKIKRKTLESRITKVRKLFKSAYDNNFK